MRTEAFDSLSVALSSPSAAACVAANLDRLVALFIENIGAHPVKLQWDAANKSVRLRPASPYKALLDHLRRRCLQASSHCSALQERRTQRWRLRACMRWRQPSLQLAVTWSATWTAWCRRCCSVLWMARSPLDALPRRRSLPCLVSHGPPLSRPVDYCGECVAL